MHMMTWHVLVFKTPEVLQAPKKVENVSGDSGMKRVGMNFCLNDITNKSPVIHTHTDQWHAYINERK